MFFVDSPGLRGFLEVFYTFVINFDQIVWFCGLTSPADMLARPDTCDSAVRRLRFVAESFFLIFKIFFLAELVSHPSRRASMSDGDLSMSNHKI